MDKPRTIAFLGRSGSGKDTQAKFVMDRLETTLLVHTGEIFRETMKKDTIIGRHTKKVMDTGGIIPHWFASFAWQKVLSEKLKGDENIIFPSSPRTLEEAKELDEVLKWLDRELPEAVLIDIPDEEAIKRMIARGRFDDNEEDMHARLSWFNPSVGPVIEYYEKEGRLHRIDGMGSIEEVKERVKKALKV